MRNPKPEITPKAAVLLSSTLQKLEEEFFFAVLDVALDISKQSVAGSSPFFIDAIPTHPRYPILYDPHRIGAVQRYIALRLEAAQFLEHNSVIESFNYRTFNRPSPGEHGIEITLGDKRRVFRSITKLRAEELRRSPGKKIVSDVHATTLERITFLADSFHRAVLSLRARRANRKPLFVKDEYDVQYLFSALLATQFMDIRPEEWGPSYAGGASRADFFLKTEGVLFETKMVRSTLTDRKLGDELSIDIMHYKQRPACSALVCFVYDPKHLLKNPTAIEHDLSNPSDHLDVRVFVRPKS